MTEERLQRIQKLVSELKHEISAVITGSVSNIIDVMFDNNIQLVEDEYKTAGKKTINVLVNSEQEYMNTTLRFAFEEELLEKLVTDIYGEIDEADKDKMLEDCACEIANVVGKRVKALLNSHGMDIKMGLPQIERSADNDINPSDVTHIHFALGEDQMNVDFAYSMKRA